MAELVEVILYKMRATKKRTSGVIMVYYLVLVIVGIYRLLHAYVEHFIVKKVNVVYL